MEIGHRASVSWTANLHQHVRQPWAASKIIVNGPGKVLDIPYLSHDCPNVLYEALAFITDTEVARSWMMDNICQDMANELTVWHSVFVCCAYGHIVHEDYPTSIRTNNVSHGATWFPWTSSVHQRIQG